MATKRTRRFHKLQAKYEPAMRVHLEFGDCLLAGPGKGCGCGLVGLDGTLHQALAAEMWRAHRAEILRDWTHSSPPYGAVFERA